MMPEVIVDNYVGRVLGDRYQLISPVGSGASATVYTADDQSLERRVAVKVLHQSLASDAKFAKRFRNEARAVAQLAHPRILTVYDWAEGKDCYIVTEFLAGGSLRHILDQGHRLSVSQAVVVGLHALEGLEVAHDAGFVHRDIKPANLLFGADGRLRIADFGIARAVAEAAWTEPEGALIGTARYAAPEQGSGATVTGAADIYSLALTLIEAVTGVVPLLADSPIATMVMRQETNVEVPAEMGPLWEALGAATKAKPDARPSATSLIRAFHRAASDLPRPYVLPLANLDADSPAELDYPEATGSTGTDSGAMDATQVQGLEHAVRPHEGDQDVVDLNSLSLTPLHFADDDLAAMGMTSGEFSEIPSGSQTLTELDELDAPRTLWPLGVAGLIVASAITALVSAWAFAPEEKAVPVPAAVAGESVVELVGMTEAAAMEVLATNGWLPVIERTRLRDEPAGVILAQNPIAGNSWAAGEPVTLVVSDGPPLVEVPVLTGLERAAAVAVIREADLQPGTVREAFNEDIQEGLVLSASAEAGAKIPEGQSVSVVVSGGPAPRALPDLATLTVEQAQELLTPLGLTVEVAGDEPSREIAEGSIVGSVRPPGSLIAKGSAVQVTASSGLPYVTVPRTRGQSVDSATAELEALGLRVAGVEGSPNQSVLVTSPPDGDRVREGTSITIITRR